MSFCATVNQFFQCPTSPTVTKTISLKEVTANFYYKCVVSYSLMQGWLSIIVMSKENEICIFRYLFALAYKKNENHRFCKCYQSCFLHYYYGFRYKCVAGFMLEVIYIYVFHTTELIQFFNSLYLFYSIQGYYLSKHVSRTRHPDLSMLFPSPYFLCNDGTQCAGVIPLSRILIWFVVVVNIVLYQVFCVL